MTSPRILIACVGNIFLEDDAFGVEVARRLLQRQWPPGVRIIDFGIRGLDLTYALMDDCDIAVLVDAVPRGEAPGTLFLIEPDPAPVGDASMSDAMAGDPLIETHGMDPAKVLRLVAAMGGGMRRVFLIGCEPMPYDSDQEMRMALSPPVEQALPQAVEMIESLVKKILYGEDAPMAAAGTSPLAAAGALKGAESHE